METVIDDRKLERIKARCGYVSGLCVSSNGRSGGMAFWWKDVNVHIKSYLSHHFDSEVMGQNGL